MEGLFYNVYAQVCSRCFTINKKAAMLPMADNINHSNFESSWEVINKRVHPDATFRDEPYFGKEGIFKMMNDYSFIYGEPELANLCDKQARNV